MILVIMNERRDYEIDCIGSSSNHRQFVLVEPVDSNCHWDN
jgi:hypothetical protein